jgi:hypothetical protein
MHNRKRRRTRAGLAEEQLHEPLYMHWGAPCWTCSPWNELTTCMCFKVVQSSAVVYKLLEIGVLLHVHVEQLPARQWAVDPRRAVERARWASVVFSA